MTKKSLFLLALSTFSLTTTGVFAWGVYDATPTTYYTYGGDLPSVYDGYTLQNDNRMSGSGLYGYGMYGNSCDATVSRNLSLGSSGEDVATVQDYLFDQDFLQSQPNSHFGYETKNAVKLFQSRYGINPTGTVGLQTMNLLNNLICGGDDHASYVGATSRMVNMVTEIPTTKTSTSVYPYSTVNTNVNPLSNNYPPSNIPLVNNYLYQPNQTNQSAYPTTVNRAPSMTILIPLNKSVYNEGDTIPATWVTSNMKVSHYSVMLTNTSTGLEKQIAALPGSLTSYKIALTKEALDAVCSGSTACTGINSNSYRMYIIAFYQTSEGELTIKAYADQMTVNRPLTLAQVILTPSKNPVAAGETVTLYGYVPNTPVFAQYQNLYWKVRAICQPGVTLTINGLSCGNDVYVYQANINTSPQITVQVGGNMWGPSEVTFEATVLSYYGGQELGRTSTKILVNK